MNILKPQPDLTDELLGMSGGQDMPASEFCEQTEVDALLRLQAGDLCLPSGLARRVRRSLWHRRLRIVLELATAAVILITFGICVFSSPSPYRLDGRAEVTDDRGQASSLVPGAWIQTSDADATLRIRGQARIDISADARVQLAGPAEKGHLKLDYGQIGLTMDKGGGQVVIETAAGKVTAGGDSSSLRARVEKKGEAGDRELTVTVVTGQATLAGPDGVVQLGPGDIRTSATPAKRNPAPQGDPQGINRVEPPVNPAPDGKRAPAIPKVPVPPGIPSGQGEAAPGASVPCSVPNPAWAGKDVLYAQSELQELGER